MEAVEQLVDVTAQRISTAQWNLANCAGRRLTVAFEQQNKRVMGVGAAGGSSSQTFVMVDCTVFTHQISFDGGNSWITTANVVLCTATSHET